MSAQRNEFDREFGRAAVRLFAVNELLNQVLLEKLDPAAWTAKAPGGVRTIVAIFTHLHNVRCKWVRLTAPHLHVPPQLKRAQCTPQQAQAGLAESAVSCEKMLEEAFGNDEGDVHAFQRDGWAAAWPVNPGPFGPDMLCYMIAHEAHHRGQVCMLAHQLGFALPEEVNYSMWNWEKLRKGKAC